VGQRQTLAWSAFRTIREMNPCRFCGYGGRISPTVNTLGTWIQKRAAIELGMTHPSSNVPKGAGFSMWEPQDHYEGIPQLSELRAELPGLPVLGYTTDFERTDRRVISACCDSFAAAEPSSESSTPQKLPCGCKHSIPAWSSFGESRLTHWT
jgi:hypothetical protein